MLEAGAGTSAATWNDVIGPIAQSARVCAYDPESWLESESGFAADRRRPCGALHALLDAAHEPPPDVMAGHFYGGMIVRLFAMNYPNPSPSYLRYWTFQLAGHIIWS